MGKVELASASPAPPKPGISPPLPLPSGTFPPEIRARAWVGKEDISVDAAGVVFGDIEF